jgi:hypothetical protein
MLIATLATTDTVQPPYGNSLAALAAFFMLEHVVSIPDHQFFFGDSFAQLTKRVTKILRNLK